MFRIREDERYQSYRGVLALIAVISLINVILIVLRLDTSLYGGAFIPMIAMFYSRYYLYGIFRYVAIGGLVVFFILVLFVCWLASRLHYRWLMMGTGVYVLDTVFMLYYIYVTGFEKLWIMDIAFHVLLLGLLIRGIYVGKHEEQEELKKKEVPAETSKDETNE